MIETTAKELLNSHRRRLCRIKRKGARRSGRMGVSMTNFEHMKQMIATTVAGLDEIGLLNLADDTEMSTSGAEGIFNCTVCEEAYGECGTCSGTRECNSKYLDWCRKEYTGKVPEYV